MEFVQNVAGDVCNIKMDGKFTFSDHEKFRTILELIKQRNAKSFIFDFANVDFVDSAALGMLLIAREESEKSSAIIILQNTANVSKMFKIAKFDALFKMQ